MNRATYGTPVTLILLISFQKWSWPCRPPPRIWHSGPQVRMMHGSISAHIYMWSTCTVSSHLNTLYWPYSIGITLKLTSCMWVHQPHICCRGKISHSLLQVHSVRGPGLESALEYPFNWNTKDFLLVSIQDHSLLNASSFVWVQRPYYCG